MSTPKGLSTVLFNKSLSTMVNGIRGRKDSGEQEYIAKCLSEIKEELATTYPDVKSQALQKLIFLQMLSYDMSWASFNVVDVMSSPWFGHKRMGYLAAALSFTKDTDVILLTTHLFRKGFTQSTSSGSTSSEGLQYDAGAAISCLANIVTPDLAMDLLSDIYGLMNSTRPYIRKKAVLVLLRIFKQWPKALRLSFDRLKEKLNDENQGVVSAAVYVICELAAKNPKNYLSLAPQFFKILTTSSNNWVLIKVVKLLGSLTPLEPRLAKKLTEPLSDIISTTPAKSLLYECVNTLLSGELKSKQIIRLCLDKLRSFIEDSDQNLKYLGLLGLHKLMKKHPKVVAEHKDLILDCLKDEDVTIRMRALDLITSMVSQRNIMGIIKKLIEHLDGAEGSYREHVLERILFIGSQDHYAYISDFEWYISTLVDLTHISGASKENALRITVQLMDVTIRVPGVRRYSVKAMSDVILAGRLLAQAAAQNAMCEVLSAAGFIVGEFGEYVEEHGELVKMMLRADTLKLSADVQNVFVQAIIKILASALLQPFDVDEDRIDTAEKSGKVFGRKEIVDEDNDDDVDEETRTARKAAAQAAAESAEDEVIEEADDLDENGVKKRKVRAKRRSFAEWLTFIGGILDSMYTLLPAFTLSDHVEVQERSVAYKEFSGWLITTAELQSMISVPVQSKQSAAADKLKSSEDESKSAAQPPPQANGTVKSAQSDVLSLDPLGSPSAPNATATPLSPAHTNGVDSKSPLSESARKEKLKSVSLQFNVLFAERLNPVNPKAQKKVPLPRGLDLDVVINEGADVDSDKDEAEDEDGDDDYSLSDDDDDSSKKKKDKKKKDKKRKKDDYEEEDYNKPLTPAEKEEAHRRQEQRKAAQAHDPFYIKDARAHNSSALLHNSMNIDEIPIKQIDLSELPPVKVDGDKERKKKSKKGGKHDDDDIFTGKTPKKTAKVFKVVNTEDMPEDAVEDDEEKVRRDDDDLDMDLTTPLAADEFIPKVKSYAEKSREEKDAELNKGKGKTEKKSKKEKKKDKKKDKTNGAEDVSKKEKKQKKEKSKHTTPTPTPQPPTVSAASAAPSSVSKQQQQQQQQPASVLDMFDPMSETPAAATKSAVTATTAATSPTASASPTSPAFGAVTLSSAAAEFRRRILFKDSAIRLRYTLDVTTAPADADAPTTFTVKLEIAFSAKSKKGKTLSALTVAVNANKKVKLSAASSNGKASDGGKIITFTIKDVAKGESAAANLSAQIKAQNKVCRLDATVSYDVDKSAVKQNEECQIVVAASNFIRPTKATNETVAALVSSKEKPLAASANKTFELEKRSFADAVQVISGILNVAVVEVTGGAATFYGQTLGGGHVAVFAKSKKDETVLVDVKTADAAFSQTLLDEIEDNWS